MTLIKFKDSISDFKDKGHFLVKKLLDRLKDEGTVSAEIPYDERAYIVETYTFNGYLCNIWFEAGGYWAEAMKPINGKMARKEAVTGYTPQGEKILFQTKDEAGRLLYKYIK